MSILQDFMDGIVHARRQKAADEIAANAAKAKAEGEAREKALAEEGASLRTQMADLAKQIRTKEREAERAEGERLGAARRARIDAYMRGRGLDPSDAKARGKAVGKMNRKGLL